MGMDPAERGGVEWVSEFCSVKGSTVNTIVWYPGTRQTEQQGGEGGLRSRQMWRSVIDVCTAAVTVEASVNRGRAPPPGRCDLIDRKVHISAEDRRPIGPLMAPNQDTCRRQSGE